MRHMIADVLGRAASERKRTMSQCATRPIRPVFFLMLATACCCGIAPSAQSGDERRSTVYDSNGFEPRLFVEGAPLLGIDGWSTAIPPFLNPDAATITRVSSRRGRQSVEVWGGHLAGSEGITAPYDAVGSYRRPLNFTVSPRKPVVVIDADLLLETDQPLTDSNFFSLTIAARSGDGETLGEMGVSSSGFAEAYDFNAAPGAEPLFVAPVELNEWQHVSMVIDNSSATPKVSYFIDGDYLGTMPTTSTSKVLLRGAMVVYALPDDESNSRDNYTARFDNFRVTVHGTDCDRD